MKHSVKTISLLAGVCAFAACGNPGGKTAQDPMFPMESAISKVSVEAAQYADVSQDEVYSSTVQAFAINNVVPQSGNRISKINVEVGDFVRKGQILAEMDRVNLTQTKLKLVNDSTELVRLEQLYKKGGLSASDFEAAKLSYDVSKSSYDNLLENTVLRSPLNGVITARNYDAGDMYAMSSPIYVVQQITPVKLYVGISESDYTKVHKGDKVSIEVDALPGQVFEGSVVRIHPTIDAATHTFNVEVNVANADRVLRPGMYARVKVVFGVNRSIVVEDSAILKQQGSGQRSVFIVNDDNTVSSRIVTIGRRMGTQCEILSGLEEGERVVVKGNAALKDGATVEII